MTRGFKQLNSTIEAIYKDLGLSDEFVLGCIKNKWPEIVGEVLSFHSKPYTFKNGELLIKVRSHLWAEELRFQGDLILQKLKSYKVKTLKFRIGKIPLNETKKANKEKEVIHTNSKKITEHVEAAVSFIKDEMLRESIKRAMEKSLSRIR